MRILIAVFLVGFTAPAVADDITETLQSAIDAYEDGDVQYAIDELDFARQMLLNLKTDSLGAFLPEPSDQWTREVSTEMGAGLAFMGGGVGAEAEYTSADGRYVKLVFMADNPMVAQMSAMISNAAAMGMSVERIGRQRFAIQDDQIMALIGNRVLVQGEGDLEEARVLLATIDFGELSKFGL
ncbi:MAG: hypothetical protein AAF636_22790 [Pseudomonadota bacterium]